MTARAFIQPELFRWARERSGIAPEDLLRRFPALDDWEAGERWPTLKQLQAFATATHTPVGYLFLAEPPKERLPVPDFRTVANAALGQASPDLLDTVYQCQQRQEWYRGYAQLHQEAPVGFVATLKRSENTVKAAKKMRELLGFDPIDRGPSWGEALRRLIAVAEDKGVLVMVSGIVGSNTHRKLDPQEFRGFALSDELAPVIFVNGVDTKAAQIFTLVHELAHLWLGQSAVSDVDMARMSANATERWCNQVAAEFLVPAELLPAAGLKFDRLTEELERLAREFKVSTLVVLRRVFDAGMLTNEQYLRAYRDELQRVSDLMEARPSSGGGDFYKTQPARVSKRFARALIESTLEGHTLHRDAFQMLGFKKQATFVELAHQLGIVQ